MQDHQDNQQLIDAFAQSLSDRGFVFVNRPMGPELYSTRDHEHLGYHSVTALYCNWCNQNGIDKTSIPADLFLELQKRLSFVIGTAFKPNAPLHIPQPSGLTRLNTFKAYEPTSTQISSVTGTPFETFMSRLFPEPEERHIVTQWLAHMFQRPEERPSWHLLLTSDTGTGKGFLFHSILTPLLCKQTKLINSFKRLTGQFSGILEESMLVMLDDAKSKSDATMTELKSILSESHIVVEHKYEAEKTVEIFSRIIFASNEYRPLRLDADERRWYVPRRIEHTGSREETQALIDSLEDWLDAGGLDTVYNYFMSYSLDGFHHKRIHQTETLKGMIGASQSVLEEALAVWLEGQLAFTPEAVYTALDEPKDLIKSKLTERGFVQKKLRNAPSRSSYWLHKSTKPADAAKWLNNKSFQKVDEFSF